MKLGWNIGYWTGGPPVAVAAVLSELESLGYESFWTSEAYGSDVFTPLAWWGAGTTRMRLGTAIAQLSARAPTATAMAAMTLDHLSDGRFVLGLGVSGPQVVEGWYGQHFAEPLVRTREYIEIVRRTLAGEGPVVFTGSHYQLPLTDGTGLGKPLKSALRPLRADLPVLLAAEGPANVALAAEIADGWIAFLFSPYDEHLYLDSLQRGFARRTAHRGFDDFEIVVNVPVSLGSDVEVAAKPIREMLALYIGGMGARTANFHYDVVARMGYETAAAQIQQRYMAGNKQAAVAAVPLELVERLALVGPPDKVRRDLVAWQQSIASTLLVQAPLETARSLADLMRPEGLLH